MCVSVRERGRKNVCERGGGCLSVGERGREREDVRDIEEERDIECV